jgi:hypothetical protein
LDAVEYRKISYPCQELLGRLYVWHCNGYITVIWSLEAVSLHSIYQEEVGDGMRVVEGVRNASRKLLVDVSFPGNAKLFSSPQCPDRIWDPPSHLSNGYRGLFPLGV